MVQMISKNLANICVICECLFVVKKTFFRLHLFRFQCNKFREKHYFNDSYKPPDWKFEKEV